MTWKVMNRLGRTWNALNVWGVTLRQTDNQTDRPSDRLRNPLPERHAPLKTRTTITKLYKNGEDLKFGT